MVASTLTGTKLCKGCGHFLDLACFGFKYPERGVHQHLCRVCSRNASRMYYQRDPSGYKARAAANNKTITARNRERLRAHLQNAACADCGLCDFAVLEFDHREPRHKRDDISNLVRQHLSWPAISQELSKCDIVCANCHRRRTAKHFGWRRLIGFGELKLPELPKRGTPHYERIKSVRSSLARRYRNRVYIFDYLREHPCELCGEKDPVVLEFDHLRDKAGEVTLIANLSGMADLLAEIAKCRVLCANCHRRHTAERAGRVR